MKRLLVCGLLLAFSGLAFAKVNITTIAAGTTIAINVLEIKQTISKIRAAAKKTKKVVKKVIHK